MQMKCSFFEKMNGVVEQFSSLQWSPNSKRILYIAEKKVPKNLQFYERKTSDPESDEKTTKVVCFF